MKLTKCSLILIISLILPFTGCKKDKISPTVLEIRLVDEQGVSVQGATVRLYKNLSDMEGQTSQVGTPQTSDASGIVTYSDLDPIAYYWLAVKECKSNANGVNSSKTLEKNITNSVTSTLHNTGTLKLINASEKQYLIYLNGNYLIQINAGNNVTIIYVPEATFQIRAINGIKDTTYDVTITCGSIMTLTFT